MPEPNVNESIVQRLTKRISDLEEQLTQEKSLSGEKQAELDKLKTELKEAESWLL